MPRTGRVVVANYPHHVVQRGHDRQAVFAQAADFERYLEDLKELKDTFDVRVFAYCLMTNHVHLLLQPEESPAGLGWLMKKNGDRFIFRETTGDRPRFRGAIKGPGPR